MGDDGEGEEAGRGTGVCVCMCVCVRAGRSKQTSRGQTVRAGVVDSVYF